MTHDLIKTGDLDTFPAIEDGQGEVVLDYCRICEKGEADLAAECPGNLRHAVQYAKPEQKEEIIRLLNHPVITRPEKTKMLLAINRFDEQRATEAIAKLRKAIDDREGGKDTTLFEAPDPFAQVFTFGRLMECAKRECKQRDKVYPTLVARDERGERNGMSPGQAAIEKAMMYRLQKMMALLASGKLLLVIADNNQYYPGQVPPL